MAQRWVVTGEDENGDETGYWEEDGYSDEVAPEETVPEEIPVDTSNSDLTGGVDTAPEAIDGVIYTKQADGTWEGDDGSVFTDRDFQTYKGSNTSLGDTNGTSPTTDGTDTGGIMGSLKDFTTWAKANPDTMRMIGGLGMAGLPLLAKVFPGLKDAISPEVKSNVYQGGIDMGMKANIAAVPYNSNPNRRPGGARPAQMINGKYTPQGLLTGVQYSKTPEQQAAIEADQRDQVTRMFQANQMPTVEAATGGEINGQPMTPQGLGDGGDVMVGYAKGGIAQGRYLRGATDGMADKLPAHIDNKQPAKLSHGEFVIPADVVSHLGNGNSDAGAQKLYSMMDKVRKARTGTKKQGKQINPDRFMPGGGIKAAFADGGTVQGFATGGTTTAATGSTGTSQGLNTTFGPYVTNMMGQANALADSPYQAYQGPLTAGASGLQQQAMLGAQSLNMPSNMGTTGFQPKSYTDQGIAGQYMNPYITQALNPQLDEMRRQATITQMGNDAKMTGAGAFGGSRQALMTTENQRNLLDKMAGVIGQGYSTAYDKGASQFNTEQGQQRQAQLDTNQYGMNVIDQRQDLGNVQRQIESEGIAADKAAFEAERDNPYKMLQFKQSMLSGMPVAATDTSYAQPSLLQQLMGMGSAGITLADLLSGTKK